MHINRGHFSDHSHIVFFFVSSTMAISKFAFCFCLSIAMLSLYADATEVSHDGRAITIDGKRRLLLSGSIHYPRSTPGVNFLLSKIRFSVSNVFFCNQINSLICCAHADVARLD